MRSAARLQEAADGNLVTHMSWVQGHLAGGHVDFSDELVVSDSGVPCDTFNVVCRARLRSDPAAAVQRVVGYFSRVGRPFAWWRGPADRPPELDRALRNAGFAAAQADVAMAADLTRLTDHDTAPGGLRIERARTADAIRDFARVNAANWSPPDAHVLRFYELATPLLLRPDAPLRLYVGYADGEAVATAELTVSEEAVGLYNIATLAAHRRKGYGTALTLRPLRDARDEGHRVAVLQASLDGQGVYARVGFVETGRYVEYQLPRDQAASAAPEPGGPG